jgi:hypothetical protein
MHDSTFVKCCDTDVQFVCLCCSAAAQQTDSKMQTRPGEPSTHDLASFDSPESNDEAARRQKETLFFKESETLSNNCLLTLTNF